MIECKKNITVIYDEEYQPIEQSIESQLEV